MKLISFRVNGSILACPMLEYEIGDEKEAHSSELVGKIGLGHVSG